MNIPRTNPNTIEIPLNEMDNTIILSPGNNAYDLLDKAYKLLKRNSHENEKYKSEVLNSIPSTNACSRSIFDTVRFVTERYGVMVKILGTVVDGVVEGNTQKAYEN